MNVLEGSSKQRQYGVPRNRGPDTRLQATVIGRQVQLKGHGWQGFDPDDLGVQPGTTAADKVASWLFSARDVNRLQQYNKLQQQSHPTAPAWQQSRKKLQDGTAAGVPQKRPQKLRFPVLHPESAFFFHWNPAPMTNVREGDAASNAFYILQCRKLWLWLQVFMGLWDALYTSFCIPISIAFVSYPCSWNAIIVLDLIAGAIFFTDILINFRTGFEVMGRTRRIVMKPKAIAKYYMLYDTFIVDALCVVPTPFVAFIMFSGQQGGWVVRYSEVLKVLLLLRLPRMWRFFAMVQVRGGIQVLYKLMSSGVLYGLNIVYTAAVLINFMACLLVTTAHMEGVHSSWLSHVGSEDLSGASRGRQYIAAVYFAMGTIAGAGYGDVVAQTPLEELVCALVMCCGCVFIGFLVGTFSHLINEASTEGRSASAFRKKLDGVEAWMRRRDLPKQLQARIKTYYVEVLQPGTEDDDLNQLSELPTALQDEVVAYLTKDVLEHSPIFGVLGKHERRYLARRLRSMRLPMGHDLFREGDDATSMYILQEGSVWLLRHTHDLLQRIEAPAFVGETVILASTWEHARFRETTCRAESTCLLWELKMKDLHQVVNVFPHIMEDLREAFLAHIKGSIADMMQQDPDKRLAYALLDDDDLDNMTLFGSQEGLADAVEVSVQSTTSRKLLTKAQSLRIAASQHGTTFSGNFSGRSPPRSEHTVDTSSSQQEPSHAPSHSPSRLNLASVGSPSLCAAASQGLVQTALNNEVPTGECGLPGNGNGGGKAPREFRASTSGASIIAVDGDAEGQQDLRCAGLRQAFSPRALATVLTASSMVRLDSAFGASGSERAIDVQTDRRTTNGGQQNGLADVRDCIDAVARVDDANNPGVVHLQLFYGGQGVDVSRGSDTASDMAVQAGVSSREVSAEALGLGARDGTGVQDAVLDVETGLGQGVPPVAVSRRSDGQSRAAQRRNRHGGRLSLLEPLLGSADDEHGHPEPHQQPLECTLGSDPRSTPEYRPGQSSSVATSLPATSVSAACLGSSAAAPRARWRYSDPVDVQPAGPVSTSHDAHGPAMQASSLHSGMSGGLPGGYPGSLRVQHSVDLLLSSQGRMRRWGGHPSSLTSLAQLSETRRPGLPHGSHEQLQGARRRTQ